MSYSTVGPSLLLISIPRPLSLTISYTTHIPPSIFPFSSACSVPFWCEGLPPQLHPGRIGPQIHLGHFLTIRLDSLHVARERIFSADCHKCFSWAFEVGTLGDGFLSKQFSNNEAPSFRIDVSHCVSILRSERSTCLHGASRLHPRWAGSK